MGVDSLIKVNMASGFRGVVGKYIFEDSLGHRDYVQCVM
jgi:hypothetical protein